MKRIFSIITVIMISTSMLTLAFDIHQAPADGGTGFEPWYYYVMDVINSASGNLYFSTSDISIRTRGFNIAIVRAYNSHHSDVDGPFGLGWTHNYNIHLEENPDYTVTEFDEDGSVHTFTPAGENQYFSPPGIHTKLTKVPEGFVLKFTDGRKYDFDLDGKLLQITDKNGNKLTLSYTDGKLSSVIDDDPGSDDLAFSYDGSRISSVVDPVGRSIDYEYDDGKLVRVRDATGNSTLYFYYDDSKLRSIVDRVSRMLIFSYYANGKIKDVWNSLCEYPLCQRGARVYVKSYLNPFKACQVEYSDNIVYAMNARGYTTEIEMNEFGNPITMTDPTGNFTFMNWDSALNMVSFTDANGNTYSYEYDAYGNLIRQTDPSDNSSLRGWENIDDETRYISLLNNVSNELGYITYYDYDSNGNLYSTTDATGNISYRFYDDHGYMVESVDFRGYSTYYSYNTHGFLTNYTDATGNVTKYGYDAVGRLTTVTDANGHATTYEYDNNDRRIKETDATGNVTSYSYNAEGELLNTFDANGHQTSYRKNTLGETDTTTDASDNATFYRYDRERNLVKETDARGYTTTYTYDPLNRLISTTDALGNIESHTYDGVGNLLSVTDENEHTTTYEYDSLNRLIRTTDPTGNETRYVYDAVGNRIKITDARGFEANYEYDPLNRLIKTTDALGYETEYSYDSVGNRLRVTDGNGHETQYEYDPLNRLISVTDALGYTERYFYDPVGNRLSLTDKNGHTTTYSYDALDRLIRVTCPLGYETEYEYDAVGNRIKEIDGNGQVTQYEYDPLNRLIRTTDALGYQTKYSYDHVGNLLSVTDANNHEMRYEYDGLSRLIKITSPMEYEIQYSYDNRGNVIGRTDANGDTITYEYDELDRRILTTYSDGCKIDYEYDSVGNLIKMSNTGGLGDTTERTYDALNRLTVETIDFGTFTKTVLYSYDAIGNILTLTYPDGETITYEYDAADRLNSVTDPFSGVTTMAYDPAGRKTEIHFPHGVWTIFSYNEVGKLTSIITRDDSDTLIFEYEYAYDGVEQVLRVIKNGVDEAIYQYNAANWLTDASYSTGQNYHYTYDPVGNRLKQDDDGSVTSYTYDAEDRVLTQTFPSGGTIQYSYDENGNVIQTSSDWGTVAYDYDYENKLTEVNYPSPYGQIATYYSPAGKRLARNERGEWTYYFPSLIGVVVEMDAQGNTTTRLNPGISLTQDSQTTYIHWDSLGSTTYFTGQSVVASFTFDFFGALLELSGDVDSVDPGLYASHKKVDWDPMIGVELIDIDYAPDIDQRLGGFFLDLQRGDDKTLDSGPRWIAVAFDFPTWKNWLKYVAEENMRWAASKESAKFTKWLRTTCQCTCVAKIQDAWMIGGRPAYSIRIKAIVCGNCFGGKADCEIKEVRAALTVDYETTTGKGTKSTDKTGTERHPLVVSSSSVPIDVRTHGQRFLSFTAYLWGKVTCTEGTTCTCQDSKVGRHI